MIKFTYLAAENNMVDNDIHIIFESSDDTFAI